MTELLFPLLVKERTAAHESLVAVFQQAFLLGGEFSVMSVHCLVSLEELFVESHIVGMLCEDGLYLLSQRIHLVVGLGAKQVEEHR